MSLLERLRAAARVAVIGLVLALAGPVGLCAEAVFHPYTPGTYRGQSFGLGGLVEVVITVDADRVLSVQINADHETEAIGGVAIQTLRTTMLRQGKVEVDAISGATKTTDAVKDALDQALSQARGLAVVKVLKDGKYVTKAMGHEGWVNVVTVFRAGRIESCRVVRHEETMGIGNYAAARVPGRVVEAQSLNVDGVSGATVTSGAVKAAIAGAIAAAGGDLSSFQKPQSPRPVVRQAVRQTVDVVIAGAGSAGLLAGARLAEKGKSVLIFEKADIPGGSMPMTYGGVLSSGTKVGAAYGLGREKADLSWNLDRLLPVLKNYLRPQWDRFDQAMPYKTASLKASGPMVDWLREIGVGFEPLGKYEGGLQLGIEPYLAPGCYQGGAGYAAMFLADRITALGGTIVYGTPVVGLSKEKGRVVGLRAQGRDGRDWEVTAGAVLLATGGFGANKDMVAQYYPAYKAYPFNGVGTNTGDGLRMGLEAGGTAECMDRPLGAFPAAYGSNFELAFITQIPGFLVNGKGELVTETSHVGMGKARLDPRNEDRFYYIFDDEGAESMRKSMSMGFSYASVFDRGEAVHYPSIAAAAQSLGLPRLETTLQDNNAGALAKKPRLSYLETARGVWAIRLTASFYLTTGGLAIDTKARVVDAHGTPIPGLFAAGDVAGSIEEKDGLQYGYGFDSAITFAYIAADTIVGAGPESGSSASSH